MEALLQGDGSEDFGRHCARQHVNVFHSSSFRVLLFPAVEHPPAKQRSQLIPTEDSPLSTEAERGLRLTGKDSDVPKENLVVFLTNQVEKHKPLLLLSYSQSISIRIICEHNGSSLLLCKTEGQRLQNKYLL